MAGEVGVDERGSLLWILVEHRLGDQHPGGRDHGVHWAASEDATDELLVGCGFRGVVAVGAYYVGQGLAGPLERGLAPAGLRSTSASCGRRAERGQNG